MLALELLGNGETRPKVHAEEIKRAVDSLQNESHKVKNICHNTICVSCGKIQTFISKCLTSEASSRPTAKQLLLSPILQEVSLLP